MKPYLIQTIYPNQEVEFDFIDNIQRRDDFIKERTRLKSIYKNKIIFKKITNKHFINNLLF